MPHDRRSRRRDAARLGDPARPRSAGHRLGRRRSARRRVARGARTGQLGRRATGRGGRPRVGVLLATGAGGATPPREAAQLLLVGARLLSYEWESISSRAELRRLAELARDRTSTDPVTGLPNRETLLAAIEREWELSKRGTVESYVVVCHLRDREAVIERYGEAMTNLLLKDVAEVLSGAIRRTDYLARVSPDGLSAVLVGCKGPEGALAFLGRAERALERATEGRPAGLQLSYGIQRLADAESTNEALELAEISARTSPATRQRHPARGGASRGELMSTDPVLGAPIAGPGNGSSLSGPGVTAPSLNPASSRFLSDILVELGFVTETQAEEAVQTARNPGQPTPEKVLLASGAISEDQLARALAERYGLEHIDLAEFPVDTSAAGLLRKTAAKRYLAAPVGFADDGALVLAVADPGDALGLSDIAVMTKLAVRPAVAARSQIVKLLDTLVFMEEPAPGESRSVSTVIVPPDDGAAGEPPAADAADPAPVEPPPPLRPDEATERELARLREELALALVARDEAQAEAASTGKHAESAAQREREEALEALRAEHERVLATTEHAAEEALRAERASAQQALASLRAEPRGGARRAEVRARGGATRPS